MEPFGHSLLVLGGARSGKSRLAQRAAEARGGTLLFVATAQPGDAEMWDRIVRHQADRGDAWRTIEEPVDLAGALARHGGEGKTMLVDCLTLWASNLLLAEEDIARRTSALVEAIRGCRGSVILVANEVGLGIVPDNALARRFRDIAGTINQQVAAAVDSVDFVAAGIGLRMKGQLPAR